jgi:tripartite-type tricarboxylate transporter receptor subunit TctC
MRRRHLLTAASLSLPLASLIAPEARAAYPERPITMIVAFPPGGGTDAAARTLARFMQTTLGSPSW